MDRNLDIRVRDSLLDPNGESAGPEMREQPGGTPLYKVHLFLEGRDLLFVRGATWHLHETFPEPVRTVQRTPSNPNCRLTIWTWGIFEIRVVVEDKGGRRYEFRHALTYGAEIERTPLSKFRSAS